MNFVVSLMATAVQLSQHVLQEGIFSEFSKISLTVVIPHQKLVLDGDGVVLITECDVSKVPWEWQITHALHKCILTYTYMYYHFNNSCHEMLMWLCNNWRLHNPIHVPQTSCSNSTTVLDINQWSCSQYLYVCECKLMVRFNILQGYVTQIFPEKAPQVLAEPDS